MEDIEINLNEIVAKTFDRNYRRRGRTGKVKLATSVFLDDLRFSCIPSLLSFCNK